MRVTTMLTLTAVVVSCGPPGPPVDVLQDDRAARAPVASATLLGERARDPAGAGAVGIEQFAQLEQVWVTPLDVDALADVYVELLQTTYEVRRGPAHGVGPGIRLVALRPGMAVTVTVLPDGPAVLAGESPPPLDAVPPDVASWATVRLAAQPISDSS